MTTFKAVYLDSMGYDYEEKFEVYGDIKEYGEIIQWERAIDRALKECERRSVTLKSLEIC